MSSILQRIASRARFLYLTTDTTEADAKRLAAKEVAQAQKRKANAVVSTPAPGPSSHSGLRSELMRRLFGGLNRISQPEPALARAAQAEEAEATQSPEPALKQSAVAKLMPFLKPTHKSKAEQCGSQQNFPLLYVGNGPGGAQLIPDEEFPPFYRYSVTQNWRRSIEWNEQQRKRMGR
jgi:hypothetical protein